jgi:hypothetical protein
MPDPSPAPPAAGPPSAAPPPSGLAEPYASAPPPPSLAPPRDFGPTTGSPPKEVAEPSPTAGTTMPPAPKSARPPGSTRTVAIAVAVIAVVLGGLAALSPSFQRTLRHAIVGRKAGAVLVVESIPSGAQVFIDGSDTGKKTPLTAENIESEIVHDIRLEREGSAAVTSTVSLVAGTEKTVLLTFPDAVVEATVASEPEDATLKVNGRKLGFTPFTAWLNVGETSSVTVEKVGYHTWSKAVTPVAGQPMELTAELEKTEELKAAEAAEAAARRAMGR